MHAVEQQVATSQPGAFDFTEPLAQLAPVAMGLIDAQGAVIWTNQACRDLFRWDPSARPTVHITEVLDTDTLGFAHEVGHRMRQRDLSELKVRVRFRRIDGGVFEADVRARVVDIGPDLGVGMLSSILPAVEAAYDNPVRRALDLQRELICEWSPGGTILYCNRAYRDWFAYGDDVVGRNIDELVTWEDGLSRDVMMSRFGTGHDTQVDTRFYDDGRAVEWANTLVRAHDGEPISVLAVGRDITERVRAQEALRRNEERFRTMVMYIWDSILLLDAEGKLLDGTSAYRTDLGYPPGTWLTLDLFDLLHDDDREPALVALASLIERGRGAEAWMELRARRVDGTYTWLELNGANLLGDPAVDAVILTVRNIERRKSVELQLEQRRRESEEALRQRVLFVAQVSHELRNPLHGMLGLSEVLAKADLEPRLADAAWALYRQSTTMRRIVDDLLDAAQLEAGTLRVHIDRVDLQYVFNDCMVVARELVRDGVEVDAVPPALDLRFVQADAVRVRQAVTNLLSNACKHTATGQIRLHVEAGHGAGTARIRVDDTGSGIDGADIARLFQPYERGKPDGTPGVGLGLAIVKGTIEAMGGHVGAEPRPGGGSTFWLELPLGAAEEWQPEGEAPAGHDERNDFGLRVLVVDDDPVNRLVATLQLRELGNDVVTASGGEEAWALLQAEPFDVAFVDVQMPGMSGLELVALAHGLPSPRPLLAVMTASATAADQAAANHAGADDFVPKPATVADIRAVLHRCAARG